MLPRNNLIEDSRIQFDLDQAAKYSVWAGVGVCRAQDDVRMRNYIFCCPNTGLQVQSLAMGESLETRTRIECFDARSVAAFTGSMNQPGSPFAAMV